jgi:hypothetical protein
MAEDSQVGSLGVALCPNTKEIRMKFRKKPVVIEATQFWINTPDGWPQGVYKDSASPTGYGIDTLEGSHQVTEGDWIITGVKGEMYPCKPDIFAMTYEAVGDDHAN